MPQSEEQATWSVIVAISPHDTCTLLVQVPGTQPVYALDMFRDFISGQL